MEAETALQLQQEIAPYTTQLIRKLDHTSSRQEDGRRASTPALWPLVKLVRVGLKNVRLVEHLTIADLPGTRDKHQVRHDTTQDHLLDCDAVWMVAGIDRIIASSELAGEIDSTYNILAHLPSDRIAVICTHSEDKTETTLKNLRTKGYDMTVAVDAAKQVQVLERSMEKEKKRIKNCDMTKEQWLTRAENE